MLDEAGLTEVRIFASGGLDEHRIADLAGAPIDAYGVGSKVGVVADAPYLDSVYKLVEYDGRPVAKLSTAKATLPGRKQVWREDAGDTIGLRVEDRPGTSLLVPAIEGGRRTNREGWREARERCAAALAGRTLGTPPPPVERSEKLERLTRKVREELLAREVPG
jgi:nicotinate phosphoribosyltransferase